MKKFSLILLGLLCAARIFAQATVQDNAVIHQEQRMVFQQWNQNQFDPKHGFLSLNPYYWLVWGFFYPNYHRTDLRPLSPAGPQTQRLALVSQLSNTDNHYALQADTVNNTAYSQLYATTGLVSDADPLWWLYYKQEFAPLLNYSATSILGTLPFDVSVKLVTEGTYDWYSNELAMLQERVNAAHSADMDRGARILAYYRLLKEYRKLNGVWTIRTSAAEKDLQLTIRQQQLKSGQVNPGFWTPQTDVQIARQVLLHADY
jgi:hypothetical protein